MTEHPSPFLPGTKIQYAWDSTSLGWLKTCPRLYQYYMIEGWTPKGEAVNLKFGRLYHSALELYDKKRAEGVEHEEALLDVVLWMLTETWEGDSPWLSDHDTKNRETLVRSVIWYIEEFKNDTAKTVILANGKPAVELSFRMELEWGVPGSNSDIQPYILCGHIDRVVEYSGGVYVSDRKTTKSALSSYYFDQYNPDNQMSLYAIAAKVFYHTPVRGVIIDAAQIMVGFTRFGRGVTYRSDAQTEEWLSELKHWLPMAEQFAAQGYWPMNDKSCHQYGGCTFRDICSKSPEVREKFLESGFEKRQWNPLEVR